MGAQTANPMAEYLLKLQLIVSNTEFMNDEEARKYETLESRLAGDKYVRAVTHTDVFESYTYADMAVYDLLIGYGYQEEDAMGCFLYRTFPDDCGSLFCIGNFHIP